MKGRRKHETCTVRFCCGISNRQQHWLSLAGSSRLWWRLGRRMWPTRALGRLSQSLAPPQESARRRSAGRDDDLPLLYGSRTPGLFSQRSAQPGPLRRGEKRPGCDRRGGHLAFKASHDERDVLAAEAEAVVHRDVALCLAGGVGDIVQIAVGIGVLVVDRGRQDVFLDRLETDD